MEQAMQDEKSLLAISVPEAGKRLGIGRSAAYAAAANGELPVIRIGGLLRDWGDFVRAQGLPLVTLHGLRHSHVSALIASGVDPLTISRRNEHTVRCQSGANSLFRSLLAAANSMA